MSNTESRTQGSSEMPIDRMDVPEPHQDRFTSTDEMPRDRMNPVTTGRFLILFEAGATAEGTKLLRSAGGIEVSVASQSGENEAYLSQGSNRAVVYSSLGVASVAATPDRVASVSAASSGGNAPILSIEQEQVLEVDPISATAQEDQSATWGLEATNVLNSEFTGDGIKVAILDTGFDLNHPDFSNRRMISQSFVDGAAVQDSHGHGTHCTGTACGPRSPQNGMRYGVAYEAQIYIGKVLNNSGSGTDTAILAGINWAIEQGCDIISMSIGGLVAQGASYSTLYEEVAVRALNQGTLIVAAAGNDSKRNRSSNPIINPVSRPANAPSILAVGAIDRSLAIAPFSNGEINANLDGGEVDLVGPGVDVFSSWFTPRNYNTISGTSMATPHVAGIAALYAQANPNARGKALWKFLIDNTKSLTLNTRDIGAGLIQAP
jgi:subtilisin